MTLSFEDWCREYLGDLLTPEYIERLVDEHRRVGERLLFGDSGVTNLRGIRAEPARRQLPAIDVSISGMSPTEVLTDELWGYPVEFDARVPRGHLEIWSRQGGKSERLRVLRDTTTIELPPLRAGRLMALDGAFPSPPTPTTKEAHRG